MGKIVDIYGDPITCKDLSTPQTAASAPLRDTWLTPMTDGLTPARLASILRNADNGDLFAQHRLFADMEERDAHLKAELDKRRLALLSLDWSIMPPRNATAAELAHSDWLTEVLTDMVEPIEDLILALMDGVGHGFSPVELAWYQNGSELLPTFYPRPQEWFRLDRTRRDVRLRDASPDGAPLRPFGWIFHTHGKAKTGYSGRLGWHRVLVWPFLYKMYSIGDFAEFLETFGLPIIVGKYFSGASDEEKDSLLNAVVSLGHDARAIMPTEMQVEIQKIVGGEHSPHLEMVEWADRAQSKAILGQTMRAEAQASGLGSGNAQRHKEVRHDIMLADARCVASTLTRDLLYPMIALNRGGLDGMRRCPRFVFDTGEAEDIRLFSESLPRLVEVGMQIPVKWAHEKMRIPAPANDEPVLKISTPVAPGFPNFNEPTGLAALSREAAQVDAFDEVSDMLADEWEPALSGLVNPIARLADECKSLEEFQHRLPELIDRMDTDTVTALLTRALFAAHVAGRATPGKA